MVFICQQCNKLYKQQNAYNKHVEKCCKEYKPKESLQSNMSENKFIELKNIFKNILNLFRDTEAITGEKALRNMSYFMTLKLMEPHIGVTIKYNSEDYEDNIDPVKLNEFRQNIIVLVRFSKIVELANGDYSDYIVTYLGVLWDHILSQHPQTKKIFLSGKGFDCKHTKTFIKIVKLLDIDLAEYDDVLAEAYEDTIKDTMIGKTFGQFFTPSVIKNMIMDTLKPEINADGTIPTCCDPTIGTGGFLKKYIDIMILQAKDRNISIDWNQAKKAIYGKEIVEETYQLAMANMLICTGHLFEELERGDSIRDPITRKFDYVLSNPPYGIKGLKYDNFTSSLKYEYTPIKSDNAVSLFLQAIIYMLNINGKCAIVLPDGKDLFGKDKVLVDIRKYLIKTCDLTEIVYMPPDIFNNTSIKTCVLFFQKKINGSDVLQRIDKNNKLTYKFNDGHQTSSVKFYEFDSESNEKKFLIDVSIDELVAKDYSLNYAEYLEEEHTEYADDIEVKTLGELFECKMGKYNSNDMDNNGTIPFYSCKANNPVGFHSEYSFDFPEYLLLISAGGSQNNIIGDNVGLGKCYYVQGKTACRANVCSLIPKLNNIHIKYVCKYLNINRINTNMKAHFTTNLGTISLDDIKSIKIPIPPLEKQKEFVEYLDIYEQANKTSQDKIKELQKLNEMYFKTHKMFNRDEVKTLGEVCDIEFGTRIVKSKCEKGEYYVYGGGDKTFTTNSYNREGFNIIISRFALSSECVRLINEKIYLNDSGLTVKPKIQNILHKYLGFYLLICEQKNIYSCARGSAQKNLDINEFKSIKIPIPSLDKQKEIVEYCEYNDNLIQLLKKEIESNKKQAEYIMNSIIVHT